VYSFFQSIWTYADKLVFLYFQFVHLSLVSSTSLFVPLFIELKLSDWEPLGTLCDKVGASLLVFKAIFLDSSAFLSTLTLAVTSYVLSKIVTEPFTTNVPSEEYLLSSISSQVTANSSDIVPSSNTDATLSGKTGLTPAVVLVE